MACELYDFAWYASHFWTLSDKAGQIVTFNMTRTQRALDREYMRQIDGRGFVRLNVLKLRQGGVTTWATGRATHAVQTQPITALTLAHDDKMPAVWLGRCKAWRDQTPTEVRPVIGVTQRNELSYDKMPSRYYVGSAGGTFPGMGDTIRFLHLSEVGSWDKAPVHVDPSTVLYDLAPALPTGGMRLGTVILRESTGKMVGDWWHRAWMDGKDSGSEFCNIFLPWYLQEEYRDDASEVLQRTPYELDMARYALAEFDVEITDAQLAWRRNGIRQDPYFGNIDEWACRYPAFEEEAFLSPGLALYTREQVDSARRTIREPADRVNIQGLGTPELAGFEANPSGEMLVWEWPNEHCHYVIGADCQWGDKDTADFDSAYVQCLETSRKVAKIKGRYPLNVWGWKLAALGHKYNLAALAPERNAKAADGLMPLLQGNVADWRYPNIWIRTDDVSLKGHRPQDYGWLTNNHTKGEFIAFSQHATTEESYDWCDEAAVNQMATIITHEDLSIGAPVGMNDDDWMASMITSYVSHKVRPHTNLYVEPGTVKELTDWEHRVAEHVDAMDEIDHRETGGEVEW